MLDFMCIGAQKCGTSWLYKMLAKHPKIGFPGGKEVHFWDRISGREVESYIHIFSGNQCINGDITPAYAILPVDIIREIYDVTPHLRLIYLIRNPMERAWSSARMALSRAEMTYQEASDQWFVDHFKSKGSLARGNYECCIRNWRSVFPSNRLLIIRYEEIAGNPVEVVNRCLCHLGLDAFFEQADDSKLREKIFEGDGAPIGPTLAPVLQDIYLKQIDSLEIYLQEDFSNWKTWPNA
jgi:hypothetical protein